MEVHTDWQMGTEEAGLVFLSLHSWLWLAERWLSVRTAVLSPSPTGHPICMSVCLDPGGGSRWWCDMSSHILCAVRLPPTPPLLLPCNLISHWSLSVIMFLFCFLGRGSQRRNGKGHWEENNSPSSSGAPHWYSTPHTPISVFFLNELPMWLVYMIPSKHISDVL